MYKISTVILIMVTVSFLSCDFKKTESATSSNVSTISFPVGHYDLLDYVVLYPVGHPLYGTGLSLGKSSLNIGSDNELNMELNRTNPEGELLLSLYYVGGKFTVDGNLISVDGFEPLQYKYDGQLTLHTNSYILTFNNIEEN